MLTFVTMHLGFSAEETAFAEEVRAFLRRVSEELALARGREQVQARDPKCFGRTGVAPGVEIVGGR